MEPKKEYKAIVWTDDELPGERVALFAATLEEARQKPAHEYGPNATRSLWNEDDVRRPRISK